jgi:hypothetical protein
MSATARLDEPDGPLIYGALGRAEYFVDKLENCEQEPDLARIQHDIALATQKAVCALYVCVPFRQNPGEGLIWCRQHILF